MIPWFCSLLCFLGQCISTGIVELCTVEKKLCTHYISNFNTVTSKYSPELIPTLKLPIIQMAVVIFYHLKQCTYFNIPSFSSQKRNLTNCMMFRTNRMIISDSSNVLVGIKFHLNQPTKAFKNSEDFSIF